MFYAFVLGVISLVVVGAIYVDIRNKKTKPNHFTHMNPHNKPGDDSNYMAGDNKYFHGGGQ